MRNGVLVSVLRGKWANTMKAVHIICRQTLGLTCIDPKKAIYRSECWDFSENEARSLIGGKIYLHESKSVSSGIGGVVRDFEPCWHPESAIKYGYAFIFQSTRDGKAQPWRGTDYQRAWTSGIVDV